jgi:O-antigen ligase
MIICLLAPFLAELLAQLGRGGFVLPSLDGPSRAILAAGIFIYLSKKNCASLLTALSVGSAIGIVLVFLYLNIYPEYYWGERAATHFVDPITLPCYVVVLMGIVAFGTLPKLAPNSIGLIKSVLIIFTGYIALESQSRTAWMAGIVLSEIWLIHTLRHSRVKQIGAVVALTFGYYLLFNYSEIFHNRSMEAVEQVQEFLTSGDSEGSSAGHRILLFYIDLELLKNYPLFGVADGVVPAFDELKSKVPSLTKDVLEIKGLAGSHSEFSAQLVRKGIILGFFALWGFFIYPLYIIFIALRRNELVLNRGLTQLLGLVLPVFISGFTIQVFNLKMTMSFYMLVLAIIFAYCSKASETCSSIRVSDK